MRNLIFTLALVLYACIAADAAELGVMPPIDSVFYYDFDNDGYGDPAVSITVCCAAPPNYVSNNLDCNDQFSSLNPDADEICDGFDNDCDGLTDTLVVWGVTWFLDADGDGFGSMSTNAQFCNQPAGYVNNTADCNDNNPSINPNVAELCNGIDEDCNGFIDDNEGAFVFHRDFDGDGYGDPFTPVLFCTNQVQPGFSANHLDCNDSSAMLNPMTKWYSDADSDGYGVSDSYLQVCTQPDNYVNRCNDCNDVDPNINPGTNEIAANDIDDDCNAIKDDVCMSVSGFRVVHYSPTAVVLVWTKMNDANNYQVQYRKVGSSWSAIKGTAYSYIKLDDLEPNTSYQFRVRTNCSGQVMSYITSAPSNTQGTIASCGAAKLGDVHVISHLSARVYWNYVPNASRYRIWFRPLGGTTFLLHGVSLNAAGEAVPERRFSGLVPGTTYEYKVQARCTDLTWSAPTPVKTFTMLPDVCISIVAVAAEEEEEDQNINQMLSENSVNISPNPAENVLNIEIADRAALLGVRIYNLTGAQIIQTDAVQQINIAELSAGIYIVRVRTELGETGHKFVKL